MSSIEIPQLGIAEIDNQHAKLVECIHRLEHWEGKGQGFAASLDALNALGDYAREHFSYEEDFLRRQGYPKLDQQIAEHQAFSTKLSRLTESVLAGEGTSDQLVAFVREWVTQHISEEDAAFAAYLADASPGTGPDASS